MRYEGFENWRATFEAKQRKLPEGSPLKETFEEYVEEFICSEQIAQDIANEMGYVLVLEPISGRTTTSVTN